MNTNLLVDLLAIDSPTGFTHDAINWLDTLLLSWNVQTRRTRKGALVATFGEGPSLAIAAHVDTLGFIVSDINSNGTLAFSPLGGPLLPSFEGAYVRVHTAAGEVIPGTVLLNNPSAHSNSKAGTVERTTSAMHIRLDAVVQSAGDAKSFGIRAGDIVAVDARTQVLANGFIKSHFLDNKAGCFVLLEIAQRLSHRDAKPPIELFFSNYEEVGHGGATGYAPTTEELLVIDMGVVGDGLTGNETLCSICAKDSGGPYDYGMRRRLERLAVEQNIATSTDVYPFYSSDGTAAWRAGVDCRVGLIGPGVHASHGMERAHVDGIRATIDLSMAYIDSLVASSENRTPSA
jgi:putative aminopeptidase FrvX